MQARRRREVRAVAKTVMAQIYKYYVYVGPGIISYFNDYSKAQAYAEQYGAQVKPMDI